MFISEKWIHWRNQSNFHQFIFREYITTIWEWNAEERARCYFLTGNRDSKRKELGRLPSRNREAYLSNTEQLFPYIRYFVKCLYFIHWTYVRRGRSPFPPTDSSELRDRNKERTNAALVMGTDVNKVAGNVAFPPSGRDARNLFPPRLNLLGRPLYFGLNDAGGTDTVDGLTARMEKEVRRQGRSPYGGERCHGEGARVLLLHVPPRVCAATCMAVAITIYVTFFSASFLTCQPFMDAIPHDVPRHVALEGPLAICPWTLITNN